MSFYVRKLEKEDIEEILPVRVALQKYDSIQGNFVVDEELVSICGFNLLRKMPSMENLTGNVAFICSVFTKEEYRGKGYQKETFRTCLDYAKSLGIVRFELGTVNPKAIEMYRQFGFVFDKNAMKLKIKEGEKSC